MPNQIPTTQWSRVNEPVLNLSKATIVEVGGVAYFAFGETILPEAGRLVIGEGLDLEMGAHDPLLPIARVYQMGARTYASIPA